MIEKFAHVVMGQLQETRASHEQTVLLGRCTTLAEYANLTGTIRGLTLAEDYIRSLLEKARKSDDDD